MVVVFLEGGGGRWAKSGWDCRNIVLSYHKNKATKTCHTKQKLDIATNKPVTANNKGNQ